MASSTQILVLQLTNRRARQYFNYNNGNEKISFMYDSGARIPIWCSGEDLLKKAFPDAVQQNMKCMVSGFGEGAEEGAVYMIPEFRLESDSAVFIIRSLYIVALNKPSIGCDFILSETMFMKSDTYTYRRDKRELHIVFDQSEFHCTPIRQSGYIDEVTVWSQ